MRPNNLHKLKQRLSISGETTDGKIVLSGCFIFMSTLGLPFDILLDTIDKNGIIIDWVDFCKNALNDGWKKTTLFNKINEASSDVYEKEYCESLMIRINLILEEL